MDRQDILDGIARLEPWFHRIDLGSGIVTKTKTSSGEPADHPLGTWAIVKDCLPSDLTGKSVLDVGCNAGFYAFEAKKRHAGRVLGVDSSRHHALQGRFVNRVLGLDVEFQRMSLYDLEPAELGQFDVTLALGLIYHCKHIVLALERLFLMTRELLVLESAILPPESTPEPIVFPFGDAPRTLLPLAWVVNDPDAVEAAQNWFLPSPECLGSMLESVGFDEVEIMSVTGDRTVITAHKQAPYLTSTVPKGLQAAITLEQHPDTVPSGADVTFMIGVENRGTTLWLSGREDGETRGLVDAGAHLLNEEEEVLEWDFARQRLPRDLRPGERATLGIALCAPVDPGRYLIEFDLVTEAVAWFENLGSPTLTVPLVVE
jgi:tRNA (mo5U34)-methyltransferase